MLKRFFEDGSDTETYTKEANAFDNEVYEALLLIMKKWIAAGYSIRECEYLATKSISDAALVCLLQVKNKSIKNYKDNIKS